VCYDVTDDGARRRLAAYLDGLGDRLQESVFEVSLPAESAACVWAEAAKMVDAASDRLWMAPICSRCLGAQQRIGPDALSDKLSAVVWVV
jgi:CRISPR-associated endonuclease Cas2